VTIFEVLKSNNFSSIRFSHLLLAITNHLMFFFFKLVTVRFFECSTFALRLFILIKFMVYLTLYIHSWLRNYATSRKVEDSNPDEIIEYFQFT
jgi:hypothetical protein